MGPNILTLSAEEEEKRKRLEGGRPFRDRTNRRKQGSTEVKEKEIKEDCFEKE